MRRTIAPDWSVYAPLGVLAIGLAVPCVLMGLERGGAWTWLPVASILGLYAWWCLILRRRVLVVTTDGMTSASLLGRPRRVAWHEVGRSVVTSWMDAPPLRLLVLGKKDGRPILTVPLKLYGKPDVAFLLNLEQLKLEGSNA